MINKNTIIISSILIAAVFWIVDTIIEIMFFTPASFLDKLILHPSRYEIYIRSVGTVFMVVPGIIVAMAFSRRKLAESKLLASEAKLNQTQQFSHVGGWEWDIRNNKLTWSDEMYRLFGISKEEFTGDLFDVMPKAIHPDDREKVAQSNLSVIMESKPIPLEYRVIWPDKSEHVLWAEAGDLILDENNHPSILKGYTQDITEIRKAEEARRESEHNFRNALENQSVGCRIYDGKGQVIYTNRAFARFHGYDSVEELNAVDRNDLLTPNRILEIEDIIGKARKGIPPPTVFEFEICCKNGETRYLESHSSEIYWDGKKRTQMLYQDITERKKAEDRLKRSEEFLKSILNSSHDEISVINVGDFTLAGANEAFLKEEGTKEDEIIGKKCFEVIHHRSDVCQFPDHICPLLETVETGKFSTAEHVHYSSDGKKLYVEVTTSPIKDKDNNVIQVVHVIRDSTERKQDEETLRLQAELLDKELDSVYLHDFEGNLIYVNRAAYVTHGYTRNELLSTNLHQLRDAESINLITHRMKEIVDKGEITFEVTQRHKNGSLIPLEIHASVIEVGGTQLIMSIAHDITERKKAQEQLMAQDRLASIGQLVSGVAHEINNPLTSVIGFSELLLRRDIPGDIKADLKIINDEAKRTAVIVKNLLIFARKQPEGKVLIQLNEQVQRVLSMRAHEQNVSNIQVNTHFAPDLPQIMGNAAQLQQVFFNIVTNAEQSMLETHHKGTLTVTTGLISDNVRVSFADDGPGISPENMNRLFTPFFTTKEVGKGTGLGLSISHGIITEHGGRIYAESEHGEGATFIIEIPVNPKNENQGISK